MLLYIAKTLKRKVETRGFTLVELWQYPLLMIIAAIVVQELTQLWLLRKRRTGLPLS